LCVVSSCVFLALMSGTYFRSSCLAELSFLFRRFSALDRTPPTSSAPSIY